MKKLILLLIALTTFINVSYASFPITETIQTEVVDSDTIINMPRSDEYSVGFMLLGFLIGFFSPFLLFLPLLLLFVPNKGLRTGIIAGFLIVVLLFVFLLWGEIFGYTKGN